MEKRSLLMLSQRHVDRLLNPRLRQIQPPLALGPVLNILLHSLQVCRWPLSDSPRKYREAYPGLQTYRPEWFGQYT